MKLHAFYRKALVPDAHYYAVGGLRGDYQTLRHGVRFYYERVVAGRVETLVKAHVDSLAVVQNLRRFAVDRLAAHDVRPVRLPDGLVAEADPEQRYRFGAFGELFYKLQGDSGFVRGAGARGDHYPVRLEGEQFFGRKLVVTPDQHFGAKLPEVLDQVVSKGVVVVYNQNPHDPRDSSLHRTFLQRFLQEVNEMTLILTEREVEELLDMGTTIEAVERAMGDLAEGRATNRARRRVSLPGAGLNVMFAGAPELGLMGLKTYSVASTGASFFTMIFDSEGGELLAIIRSNKLGQLRTGAATGVGVKHLAREDASTVGIYGTGWQAESQLEAVVSVMGSSLERVIVYSRREESRKEFADLMSARLGIDVETTSQQEEPAAQDVVVTVTSSPQPVLKGEWLRPGAHVTAAGSNFLIKSETDRDVVRRASFVCVDSREELGLEAGDLLQPLETGTIFPEGVYELGSGHIRAGDRPPRSGRHYVLRQPGVSTTGPGRRPHRLRPGH